MSEESLFKKLFEDHQPPAPESEGDPQGKRLPEPESRKRGRPATGKRSDPGWIGRTFYIQKETDLDVEAALLRLKRQGIEVDMVLHKQVRTLL